MAAQVQWHFSGDYFENCNCSVVCPCLVSKAAPPTSRSTEGVCNLPLLFHIETGSYGGVALDGLNVALVIHAPAQWRKAIGRSALTPINAPTINRPKHSARFSPEPLAGR
jgi:hypothetical protein